MNKPVFTIDVGGINTEEIYANAVMSREDSSRLRISCPDEVEKDEAPYSDHYKGFPFEPVDIAEAYQLNFNEGNIVKYLLRWRKKDGIKDLHKARYYIERLISLEERRLREKSEQLSERGLAQKILSWVARTEQENMQEDISLEGVANRFMALVNDIEKLCKERIGVRQRNSGQRQEEETQEKAQGQEERRGEHERVDV